MNKGLNKRFLAVLVVILVLLVAAVAVMIFLLSDESAEKSSQTSYGVMVRLLRLFIPGFDEKTPHEKHLLCNYYHPIVRKFAHGFEFMLLGTFLFLALHGLKVRKKYLASWLGGTFYAGTDELHQMLVDGRGPMWQDVCIDSGGVLLGILLGRALLALFRWIWPPQEEDTAQK